MAQSIFAIKGRDDLEYRHKNIAMFQIRTKVEELHHILQKAEKQGDIRLEEFSVSYAYGSGVKCSPRYSVITE